MARSKVTTSKIIIAAAVILLCLISITGATLALFTSDEDDGTIGINATSGKVKVDIVNPDDEEDSYVGGVLDFVVSAEGEDALFEPGAVYHTEGFRVKNTGDIPLYYILYISEDKNVSADFSEAFEVWITNDLSDRASAVKLQEYDNKLAPGKSSDVFYLVFKMKETAGNEYQNKIYSGVGVTVCAVQGNAVED